MRSLCLDEDPSSGWRVGGAKAGFLHSLALPRALVPPAWPGSGAGEVRAEGPRDSGASASAALRPQAAQVPALLQAAQEHQRPRQEQVGPERPPRQCLPGAAPAHGQFGLRTPMGGGTGQPLGPGLHPNSLPVHPPAHEPLPCGHPGGGGAGPLATSTALNSQTTSVRLWLPSLPDSCFVGQPTEPWGCRCNL